MPTYCARPARTTFAVHTHVVAVLVMVLAGTAAAPLAQSQRSRSFDDLARAIPQVTSESVLEVRVRWTTASPARDPATTASRFQLRSTASMPGVMRAHRLPQVDGTTIVVVSLDRDGRELDWRTLADPRVIRAEASGGAQMTPGRAYRIDTEMAIHLPALPSIASIHLYSVRASGGRALLQPLGVVDLP